ncbi:uncharacterized protein EV420DRAFT_171694 [Desarmillaria tabescens]|uniref:Uncharacterized protein n=1 Tax=Armillaria tabescens TaxID=1929756 RepID=A0AA39N8I9_ARMTA|nr:uncharacterized protein EV420DRAFT_171694 [Desarmillaria tabescens]KAK0461001.1 hypothetical protein EV420DRAFT_171694 [Desarmillaria tabescens]
MYHRLSYRALRASQTAVSPVARASKSNRSFATGYWYYSHPNEVANLEAKAKRDEEELKRKASLDSTIQAAEAKARQASEDAQAKYESYKSSGQKSLSDARGSTENLYNEARATGEKKYDEAKAAAENKKNEAKASWASWLGWGRSKSEEVKKDVRDAADKNT